MKICIRTPPAHGTSSTEKHPEAEGVFRPLHHRWTVPFRHWFHLRPPHSAPTLPHRKSLTTPQIPAAFRDSTASTPALRCSTSRKPEAPLRCGWIRSTTWASGADRSTPPDRVIWFRWWRFRQRSTTRNHLGCDPAELIRTSARKMNPIAFRATLSGPLRFRMDSAARRSRATHRRLSSARNLRRSANRPAAHPEASIPEACPITSAHRHPVVSSSSWEHETILNSGRNNRNDSQTA